MSTVTSPEVAVESDQATPQEEDRFVVIHGDHCQLLDDLDEAVELAKALNTVHGGSSYVGERIATIGDNGSNDKPVNASTPESDVVIPESHFGTIRIELQEPEFRPTTGKVLPRLMAERLPHAVARELAIRLNAETLTRDGGRWHFLVCSWCQWYGVLRIQCLRRHLPKSPDSYSISRGDNLYLPAGHTKRDVLFETCALNESILETARIPRVWNLVVRDLRDEPTALTA